MTAPRATAALTFGTTLAVALTLAGYAWPSLWLVYVFKPLATVSLVLLAAHHGYANKSAYSQWIVIGLLFSLLGDILLIWPHRYFLPGLAAFLFTHVFYLIAFTRDCRFPARVSVWIAYLGVAASFYAILFPTLPAGLRLPVGVYAALLSTMAAQAMGRFFLLRDSPAQRAAVGALLFMLSDLLLAFHRFRRPLLYSSVLILAPYYIGQWLIASSIMTSRAAKRLHET